MSPEIEVKGIDLLNELEKGEANGLLEDGFKKLKRKLKESSRLKVHIKVYSPEGNRRKFSNIAISFFIFCQYYNLITVIFR